MQYTKANSIFWDKQAESGDDWTIPVSGEAYRRALEGELTLHLTPCKPVSAAWFPPLKGASVFGLASGGGQQGPIFAAHGAQVTIMDLSDKQLAAERMVAEREGYSINIVKGDMTQPFPFEDDSFDLIFHPVSNCYVEDIRHIWVECHRVLKKGGTLLAGFCKEELFLFDCKHRRNPPLIVARTLPHNPLNTLTKAQLDAKMEKGEVINFSHTLEEQIGGQIAAGFSLQGIYDDRDRWGVFAQYMNSYTATWAVKL